MKKPVIFLAIAFSILFFPNSLKAQLNAGTEGLFIKSGTSFSVDGLTLIPSDDLYINNLSVIRESLPVNWPQYNGIRRIYHFSSPVMYRGYLALNYMEAELNGNKAAELTLAYTSTVASTDYANYTFSSLSAVNVNKNIIAETIGTSINFSDLTAVTPGFLVPPVTPSEATTICEGTSVTLSTVAAMAWQWYRDGIPLTGSKRRTLVISQSGNYAVRTTFSNGVASTSFPVPVNVSPPIEGGVLSDTKTDLSLGAIAKLTASGGTSYQWESADGIINGLNSDTLVVRPTKSTTYQVIISNSFGCNTVKTIEVVVANDYKTLEANNLITPNGDGINDFWLIKNIDLYPNNELKIFDRAGRVVFSQTGYNNTWDGTFNGIPLSEDTYYYVLYLDSGKGKLTGFISVVRQ
ncbi:gliding motility-associated C-terminal domain-containing protein [Arcticibacter svalbardensis]|nr:gliding motility-associated C-terminal domain-containing protein [Arcticibacter svalbardensis]